MFCFAAILLYNHGDLDGARQRFAEFQTCFANLGDDGKAADSELLEQQQMMSQLLGVTRITG